MTVRICAIGLVAALALGAAAAAWAAEDGEAVAAEEAAPLDESRAELAREFNDPLTAVPQIFVQDAYSPSTFGTEAQSNRVIARLILPRVPRFSLFPLVQLIRPSMSLVTVPTGRGRGTRTELGDMQLFDLAVLPWPKRETGIYMGVGPVLVFPTATHETAGQGAWQVGPAFGMIYKGIPGLLLGILVQNPVSFEYTSQDRRPVSTLLVQPIIVKHIWHGLYVKSADATWSFGWYDGSPTTVPLSLGLGWVIPRDGSPPLNLFVSGEWMAHRENAPVVAQATVRFGLTVAIPALNPR